MAEAPNGTADGWWVASDGRRYPSNLQRVSDLAVDAEVANGSSATFGWWLASDGRWYPPELHASVLGDAPAEVEPTAGSWPGPSPGPGWWLASDYHWYPPQLRADAPVATPAPSAGLPPSATPAPFAGPARSDASEAATSASVAPARAPVIEPAPAPQPGAVAEAPPGPGWWLASDHRWYPPELHADVLGASAPTGAPVDGDLGAGFSAPAGIGAEPTDRSATDGSSLGSDAERRPTTVASGSAALPGGTATATGVVEPPALLRATGATCATEAIGATGVATTVAPPVPAYPSEWGRTPDGRLVQRPWTAASEPARPVKPHGHGTSSVLSDEETGRWLLVAALGGALVLVMSFLPWYRLSGGVIGRAVTFSLVSVPFRGWRLAVPVLAGSAALLAVAGLGLWLFTRWRPPFAWALRLVALALAVSTFLAVVNRTAADPLAAATFGTLSTHPWVGAALLAAASATGPTTATLGWAAWFGAIGAFFVLLSTLLLRSARRVR